MPPILFIHGMWADRAHWNRFRRNFAALGFETHAVTLLSHETPQDMEGLRHAGILDYVAQVGTEVSGLSEAPVLIGHSMGSLVAQKLAESIQPRSVVLLSPIAPRGISVVTPTVALCALGNTFDAFLRRPFIIPERNARYGILNTLSPREQTVVYQSFLWESGRALWEILTGAIRVDASRVRCPVLIAVGSEDRATPPSIARRIADKYDGEYREYPGRCHFLSASHEVIDDVVQWVLGKVQG
jgi:pimeloyl-ACP methyl ester carboxylesterase